MPAFSGPSRAPLRWRALAAIASVAIASAHGAAAAPLHHLRAGGLRQAATWGQHHEALAPQSRQDEVALLAEVDSLRALLEDAGQAALRGDHAGCLRLLRDLAPTRPDIDAAERRARDRVVDVSRKVTARLKMQDGIGIRGWLMIQLVVLLALLGIWAIMDRFADASATSKLFSRLQEMDTGKAKEDDESGWFSPHREDKEDCTGHVQVLNYISIEPTGGLDQVRSEFGKKGKLPMRLVSCGLLLVGGLANVFTVTWGSIKILDAYLLWLGGVPVMEIGPLENWNAITESMRLQFLPLAAFVAAVEMILITGLVAMLVEQIIWHFRCPVEDQFERYESLRTIIWDLIPGVSTTSALKVLMYVHPSLVAESWEDHSRNPMFGRSRASRTAQKMFFVLSRIFALYVGITAFSVKVVLSGATFKDFDMHILQRWAIVGMFLYQTLSIVLIEQQFNKRILRMLFGGDDAHLTQWERDSMRVYEVRLVRAIVRAYTGWRRLGLLFTFGDDDFQRLFLEEDQETKNQWKKKTERWTPREPKSEATPSTAEATPS